MTDEHGRHERSVPEQVADLVFFAPYGFALEVRRLYPELAARGRRQLVFTRTVGKYAVKRGQARVDDLLATGIGLVSAFLPQSAPEPDPDEVVETAVNLAAVPDLPVEPQPDADHLAIPDYDNLSAFQVVPRLEALGQDDLAAVREYEESTRGRRTILNKIAQLS